MPDTRETFDDERLMQYLIGSLDEPETERFDDLSITDDEFAGRLRIVEDEMVDAYARGELTNEVRARFETHYLTLPGKQDRVRFAQALAFRKKRQAPARAADQRSVSHDRRAMRTFVWPLVAAASIAIAVVGYVLLQRSPEPSSSKQSPTASASNESPAPEPRDRPSVSPATPSAAPLAIVLMPSTRRAAEPPTVPVLRGAPTVDVRLVLEEDDFPTYAVALKDAGSDRVLWRGFNLKASSSGAARAVIVSLSAELLKPRHYTLDLSGVRASGRSEVITSYPFRVMVK